jgi:Asp-tRNA(Asn)/Glu-tRNA(Gln) amidotransferase C subunit
VALPALSPDEATRNAPDREDDQFRVSAVLDE